MAAHGQHGAAAGLGGADDAKPQLAQGDTRGDASWGQLMALKALEADISRSLGKGAAASVPAPELLFSRLADDLMSALTGRPAASTGAGRIEPTPKPAIASAHGVESTRHTGDLVRLLRTIERQLAAPKPDAPRARPEERLSAAA